MLQKSDDTILALPVITDNYYIFSSSGWREL